MMIREPSPPVKVTAWTLLAAGTLALLPAASYAYSFLAHYQYRPLLLVSGIYYDIDSNVVFLSTLAALLFCYAPGAFIIFFLYPRRSLHGDARLANTREIRKARLFDVKGDSILLGRYKGRLLAFNNDLHPFLAAPTGQGKDVSFVTPNMLHWTGSMIGLDIKRENYTLTSGYRCRVLKQDVFLFDPMSKHTHCFNPFDYLRPGIHRVGDVQNIASILIPIESGDPHWDRSARDLFTGLTLLLCEAHEQMGWKLTIAQINAFIRTKDDPAEFFLLVLSQVASTGCSLSKECQGFIHPFCNEPVKTRGAVISSLRTKLSIFVNPLVARATSTSDFDLRLFRRQPITLYLGASPNDIRNLAPVFHLLFSLFISLHTRAGETPRDDPGLNIPVLMMMNEFLSLGRVDLLVHALSYVRGWGIKFATVIQSPTQLESTYDASTATYFMENHRASLYFRPPNSSPESAHTIANMIGDLTVKQRSYTYSRHGRTRNLSEAKNPVVPADDIKYMRPNRMFAFVDGIRPIYAKRIIYYKDRLFKKRLLDRVPLPPIPRTVAAAPLLAPPTDDLVKELHSIQVPTNTMTDDQIDGLAHQMADSLLQGATP